MVQKCVAPPEVKFHVFGTSNAKHGNGRKIALEFFFAILISTWWRFYRANKKICHINFKKAFHSHF